MLRKITAALIIPSAILIAYPAQSVAQLGDAGAILRAGKQDANTLLKAYFKPAGKGFGSDLNSGWFNTAKTHSTLGFGISVNASVARVPGADRTFNVQDLNLERIEYVKDQSASPMTPTAFDRKSVVKENR